MPGRAKADRAETDRTRHLRTYAEPRWYDVAFGYRDVPGECTFLLDEAARLSGSPPASAVELGAGPANHAVELARRGLAVQAVDLEPAMVRYGLEKAAAAGVSIAYAEGDIREFALPRTVDLALMLLNTAGCIETQGDFIAMLQHCASALNPGGILCIELPHPRDIWLREPGGWEVEQDGIRVRVAWGSEGDSFDPVTQLGEVTTTLTVWEGGRKRVLRDRALQRHYTAPEIAALARLAGGALVPAAWHGALEPDVPASDPDRAWRLVAFLRKEPSPEGSAP
ncbi:class I SAM-dependent methyltransferase [Arenibaculum pallidiluteum]|uniref:class I SAM-dependent methyltransferase n=1 Tax=Arenibaculum pallidiluteum TaxID=2812559 RepID=UPI001A95B13B|nr:class I SAM-dependent methyltransferase [Arenibaculum pallidiluteum]